MDPKVGLGQPFAESSHIVKQFTRTLRAGKDRPSCCSEQQAAPGDGVDQICRGGIPMRLDLHITISLQREDKGTLERWFILNYAIRSNGSVLRFRRDYRHLYGCALFLVTRNTIRPGIGTIA